MDLFTCNLVLSWRPIIIVGTVKLQPALARTHLHPSSVGLPGRSKQFETIRSRNKVNAKQS